MAVQEFTIVVDQVPTDEQVDAIFERFDYGVGGSPREGIGYIEVSLRVDSLAEAIETAMRDIESVGLRPLRIEDENWVTLGSIAERIGKSREAIRLWATGKQGPGGFPPPLNPWSDTSFYSWAEVAPWLRERLGLEVPDPEPVLAAANLALQLRNLIPRIEEKEVIARLAGLRRGDDVANEPAPSAATSAALAA